ncbi:MAG: rhodanese-like domain-containing protein [Pararhodobacter sp.]
MPQNLTRRGALSIALAFGLLAAPALHADAPESLPGATTVNAEGVIELIMNTPNLVILDNRREADYAAGHIEGAVRLIDTDITGPEVLAAHGANNDTPVLFYCNGLSCGRAANAAQMALDWGYSNVHYYALGMSEWNSLGLPVVSH